MSMIHIACLSCLPDVGAAGLPRGSTLSWAKIRPRQICTFPCWTPLELLWIVLRTALGACLGFLREPNGGPTSPLFIKILAFQVAIRGLAALSIGSGRLRVSILLLNAAETSTCQGGETGRVQFNYTQ